MQELLLSLGLAMDVMTVHDTIKSKILSYALAPKNFQLVILCTRCFL
jgi:hypothetical protein